MIIFWRAFFATAILLTSVVPHLAFAADCSEQMSYDNNITSAKLKIENKDLIGASDCLRIARKLRQRPSADLWYTYATLELTKNNGELNDNSENYLLFAAADAGLDGGWYGIELSKHLLRDSSRIDDAFNQLNKVNPILARLAVVDLYLSQNGEEIEWDLIIGHLDKLEQQFRDSGERDNARMALGLRAAVRAFQIDEVGLGLTKASLEDAKSTIRKLLDEDPQHPLANYILGYLQKWLSQNKEDVSAIQAGFASDLLNAAVESFNKPTPAIGFTLKKKTDDQTAKSIDEMMNMIVGHLQLRLDNLPFLDIEPPEVKFPVGSPYSTTGTVIGTSELRVWIPLNVTDDRALKALEFSVAWGGDLNIPGKKYELVLNGNSFTGLIKLNLPANCERTVQNPENICRITITTKDNHNRFSLPLQFDVQVTRRRIGQGKVFIAGIEEYENNRYPRLEGLLENDIGRLVDYFRLDRGIEVIPLPDPAKNINAVNFKQLHDLMKEVAKTKGYALFFFSGHGMRDGNSLSIVTQNGEDYPLQTIMSPLTEVAPMYLGVIIDACNVQFSENDLRAIAWQPEIRWEAQRMLISAVNRNQRAKMRDNKSVFLDAFLAVLRAPDQALESNNDSGGYVSLADVFKAAKKKVDEDVPGQTPSKAGWADNFIITEVPADIVAKRQLSYITENTHCVFVSKTSEWVERKTDNSCRFDDKQKNELRDALKEDSKHPATLAIKDLLVDYARLAHNIDPDVKRTREQVKERIVQLLFFFLKMDRILSL